MDKIKELNIKDILLNKNIKQGIEKYAFIIKEFQSVNVQTNKVFQKKFNGFYRVRRNEKWQKIYYQIMETSKKSNPTFEYLIRLLYNETGKVEASFTSKLLHTLNNDMPIWDKFVLLNLNKKIPTCRGEEKLKYSIKIYDEILAWYDKALKSKEIQKKLSEFDKILPEYTWLSPTKKLDFLLWQMR